MAAMTVTGAPSVPPYLNHVNNRAGASRRAILGGGGLMVAAASISLVPVISPARPVFGIEELWAALKLAMSESDAVDWTNDRETREYWEAIGTIEQAIVNRPFSGPRAAVVKLWVALNHCAGWTMARDCDRIVWNEDYRALRAHLPSLDFDAKAIASAILLLSKEA